LSNFLLHKWDFRRNAGTLETQELFPKAYFTHKTIYACLRVLMSSWNMQQHWVCIKIEIRTYFSWVTSESVGGFRHFAFCIKVPRLATFLLHIRTAVFEAHFLSPLEIWRFCVPKSYQVFMEPLVTLIPLLHPSICMCVCVCVFCIYIHVCRCVVYVSL